MRRSQMRLRSFAGPNERRPRAQWARAFSASSSMKVWAVMQRAARSIRS